jgi:hypothetical protein
MLLQFPMLAAARLSAPHRHGSDQGLNCLPGDRRDATHNAKVNKTNTPISKDHQVACKWPVQATCMKVPAIQLEQYQTSRITRINKPAGASGQQQAEVFI